ncbi:MAG TPA: alpha/beta hydrolase [Ktedonobacterales bacterium]
MADDEIDELLERLAREAMPPTARISYGEAPSQFGDLRLPTDGSAGPWPVAIMVHGGYWRVRYDGSSYGAIAGALTTFGIATWNIEYRRLGEPGGGWPGTFEDVADAADSLRGLAERYPLDLSRVVTLGHSAGGHLALWLAARPRLPMNSPLWRPDSLPISGVVSLAGVANLRRAWELRLSDTVVEKLLDGAPKQVPARYDDCSPFELLPLGVPQAMLHGTIDDIVPFEISAGYVERARSLGDNARLLPLEGCGHFEVIDPSTAAWRDVAQATRALIGS